VCRALAEGGRRCDRDTGRLQSLGHADLLPESSDDRPEVTWSVPGHTEPPLAELWSPPEPSPGTPVQARPAPKAVVAEAVGTLHDVRAVEPEITSTVLNALPPGARAHGLEFRLKSPSSLARKIADRVRRTVQSDNPQSPHDVASRLTDIVRYTVIAPDGDSLAPTARTVVTRMGRAGYKVVEAEHSYVEGSAYKGLHLLFEAPGGLRFELQVHSELSQKVKDEIHVGYEKARMLPQGDPERDRLVAGMQAATDSVPIPAKIRGMRKLGGIQVEKRKK